MAISANGFLERSNDYLTGLNKLCEEPKSNLVPPIGLLASHCIELALKAYLIHIGYNETQIKDLGHNLSKAWDEAKSKGLKISSNHKFTVDILSIHHDRPFWYRYPEEKIGVGITEISVLYDDVKAIYEAVEASIS